MSTQAQHEEIIELDLSEQDRNSIIEGFVFSRLRPESVETFKDAMRQNMSYQQALEQAIINEWANDALCKLLAQQEEHQP